MLVIPPIGGSPSKAGPRLRPYLKSKLKQNRLGSWLKAVEHKALSSKPRTIKKNNKFGRKINFKHGQNSIYEHHLPATYCSADINFLRNAVHSCSETYFRAVQVRKGMISI
jgi:hypothetical protein